MCEMYLNEMLKSEQWEIVYICDLSPISRENAKEKSPGSKLIEDEDIIFNDPEIQVVGLFTLADARQKQIRKAIAAGKTIIAEKPLHIALRTNGK